MSSCAADVEHCEQSVCQGWVFLFAFVQEARFELNKTQRAVFVLFLSDKQNRAQLSIGRLGCKRNPFATDQLRIELVRISASAAQCSAASDEPSPSVRLSYCRCRN